ncbi:MAG TPA: hypothetical protein VF469_31615, partial [Kofleriaceae bacterium]
MRGKVGTGASPDQVRDGVRPALPVVGKQTLVEQLGGVPDAADVRAARPAGTSVTGLPRLQLKDIPARSPATTLSPAVQRTPAAPGAAT